MQKLVAYLPGKPSGGSWLRSKNPPGDDPLDPKSLAGKAGKGAGVLFLDNRVIRGAPSRAARARNPRAQRTVP